MLQCVAVYVWMQIMSADEYIFEPWGAVCVGAVCVGVWVLCVWVRSMVVCACELRVRIITFYVLSGNGALGMWVRRVVGWS